KELEQKTKERGVRRQEVRRLTQTIDTLMARLDLPGDASERPPSDPTVPAVDSRTSTRHTAAPVRHVARPHVRPEATGPERDPLTADVASRVLSSVEVSDGPNGTGGRGISRFRLEPWEVLAARRILTTPAAGGQERLRDLLFFESALVRIRIDEEAQQLRSSDGGDTLAARLAESAHCLARAQDLDRRFRAEIDSMGKEPERVKEVNRSRFRLL